MKAKKEGRGRPPEDPPTVPLCTRVSPAIVELVKQERRKHHGSLRHAIEALVERGARS